MVEAIRDPGTDAIRSPFSLDDIPWEGGRILYRWWNEARGGRAFPSRADFDPAILKGHLATVVLHDVEHDRDPPDFRIRLIGTEIVSFAGFDPTGRPLDALPNTAPIRARYSWLVRTKRPYLCLDLPLSWVSKEFISYSTLAVPLGRSDEHVDMLMSHLDFRRLPA